MRNPPSPLASRAESLLIRLKRVFGFGAPASKGIRGERAAENFLRRRGYTVTIRNWRNPKDRREEIDLVARDGEVLVFIEVKARGAQALVSGFHAVNSGKKTIMRRAITAYLRALPSKPHTFRFDVVEVSLPIENSAHDDGSSRAELEVRHYENVPLFPKHFQP